MEPQAVMPEFATMPDAETFRRVWNRVMPDDSVSPIAFNIPEASTTQTVECTSQNPVQQGATTKTEEKEWTMVDALEQLLQEICLGVWMTVGMASQYGVHSIWGILHRQRRQGQRKLEILYFLQTGGSYTCQPISVCPCGTMQQRLRQQYIWERDWEQHCKQCAERIRERELQELCGELETQSEQRRQRIRQTLEGT